MVCPSHSSPQESSKTWITCVARWSRRRLGVADGCWIRKLMCSSALFNVHWSRCCAWNIIISLWKYDFGQNSEFTIFSVDLYNSNTKSDTHWNGILIMTIGMEYRNYFLTVPWVCAPWRCWSPSWPIIVLSQQMSRRSSRGWAGGGGTLPGSWTRGYGHWACRCRGAGSCFGYTSPSPSPATQPSPGYCQSNKNEILTQILHIVTCTHML